MELIQMNVEKQEQYTLLRIEGNVNFHTFASFEKQISGLIDEPTLCLDMARVTSLSSSGLGVLVAAAKAFQEKGHRLYILNPSKIAFKAMEIIGFTSICEMISSLDEIESS